MKDSMGVNIKLPLKEEIVLLVPLSPLQRSVYMQLITQVGHSAIANIFGSGDTEAEDQLNSQIASGHTSGRETLYKQLRKTLISLRMVCAHPYVIDGIQPEPYVLGDHVIHASSKFVVVDKLVQDLV